MVAVREVTKDVHHQRPKRRQPGALISLALTPKVACRVLFHLRDGHLKIQCFCNTCVMPPQRLCSLLFSGQTRTDLRLTLMYLDLR